MHRSLKSVLVLFALLSFTREPVAAVQILDPPVVDLKAADRLSEVGRNFAGVRVVYVGEVHTAFEDHLVQLSVVRQMYEQDPNLAIGVEWFQQPYQGYLDQYIKGEIDEGEMLTGTEYYSRWSFDYRLYRPIMLFAREHRIPVIALNAPTELIRAIRSGGRENVPEDLRRHLPASYAAADAAYQARLRQVFDSHPEGDGGFDRFVEIQLTWDESMAERAADYLAAHGDTRMAILAGRGHIGHGSGIPSRVARRSGAAGKIVLVAHGDGEDREAADLLVLARRQDLPEQGLMGVMLDSTGTDTVKVVGVSPGGAAEAAGVQKDDIVVAVDGRSVKNYADIKLALMDKGPGDRVALSVRREGLIFSAKDITFDFELQGRGPFGHRPHP